MDKIKTVKIKNPDGSVSEETYTISVDARNVDMDNGKDLQDTVGNINVDEDGNIAEQLNKKIDKIYIEDNLNSTNTDKALSANQGRILNNDLNKKPYYYDTIIDMKADVKLKVGDMTITLGCYEVNDGLGAKYKIVNDNILSDDNKIIYELDNGLYAILIIDNKETDVSQLGIIPGILTETQIDNLNIFISENSYCSLKFGKGEYILTKPIMLLQGSSISGIGNNTKLKSTNGQWAIVCKGLVNINSTTEIYNLTIDGNFEGNGIYIDGSRYSRCEIHDVFIVSCLYGLRNAKPSVVNVYDNNFGVGNGGNNIHDIYIYGETPNDDTSRCINGLVLLANDNFITNVRVSGYNNYGIYINGSGNQFSNLKAGVNHIGCRITGGQNFGTICAEESFQNNFELNYVRNSELVLKTASAGCVVSDNLPTNLQYFDVHMEHCSQNNIQICGFVAQSFTYRKAGELAFLNLIDSILNNIEVSFGNSQIPNKYCLPLISNCAFANNVKINTNDYVNFIDYDILDEVTIVAPTNITITGDYPNLTVVNTSTNAQQNLIGIDLLDLYNKNLVIFDKCFGAYPPQYVQIQFRFNGDTNFNNFTTQSQFISSYGENGAVIIPINIKEVLETVPEYIEGKQQGKTLGSLRVFLKSSHAKQGTSKHNIVIAKIN